MLIPYSTDAPLYHYPISTISLIVVNVVLFFATGTWRETLYRKPSTIQRQVDDSGMHEEPIEASNGQESFGDRLTLQFGVGYRPWQWLTSMFMHLDLLHLIGNMIFLWSFGLVIEGKLGNIKFLSLYLAMGIFQSLIVQTIMLGSVGIALGASGAIFSLLAMVVIFAPVNNFEVLLWIVLRPFTFEMPILGFGSIYVFLNVAFFFIGGPGMGTEALHLIGFLVGIPVALFMLVNGKVDCEGYDLISYLKGTEGKKSTVGKKPRRHRSNQNQQQVGDAVVSTDQQIGMFRNQIGHAIQEKNWEVAVALQRKLERAIPGSTWDRTQLAAIIKALLSEKKFEFAIPLLEDHIRLYSAHRFGMQSNLIKIWLHQDKPRRALRYMEGLDKTQLSETETRQIEKLTHFAKKQVADGVLEFE